MGGYVSKKRERRDGSGSEAHDEFEGLRGAVRAYLGATDASLKARSYKRLFEASVASVDAVFELRAEAHGAHEDALTLLVDLAKRFGHPVTDRARAVLRDDRRAEGVRLLALETLAHRAELPPWRELEAIARCLVMPNASGFMAACIARCDSVGMSTQDRIPFLHYLTDPRARRQESGDVVIAAIERVEGLLFEDVVWEHRELAFDACFDLLRHPSSMVRARAFDAICAHCPLNWFERLRFVRRSSIDHRFLERLHGLVNRLWSRPLDLLSLSPNGFEYLVREWLRTKGYTSIRLRGEVHDEGVDLVAEAPDGVRCIVQCKRWKPGSAIGQGPVVDLNNTIARSDAQRGVFVTTTSFTASAKRFRDQMNSTKKRTAIELVDGTMLVNDFESAWGSGEVLVGVPMKDVSAQLRLDGSGSTKRHQK